MYKIFKITSNSTIDFAAEELKKYLRMLMPRCGEVPVSYEPEAASGFRIGLMSDFGLDTSDARRMSPTVTANAKNVRKRLPLIGMSCC